MPEIILSIEPHYIQYLRCSNCGKHVSTGFIPITTDTPDKGIIIRAWIECPECIEKKRNKKVEIPTGISHNMGQ